MNAVKPQLIAGAVGDIEVVYERPAGAVRALALICHPHPLHGGAMDNKVVTTLARACLAMGCATLRFNFRGVGASQGQFDHAVGEVDDAACALAWLQSQNGTGYGQGLPVVLCGFSFGTAVAAQLAQRLLPGQLAAMILAGAAVQRFGGVSGASGAAVTVPTELTLLVHGELDDTVPLAETLAWAAPQALPIAVVPQADHFFNRQLTPLKTLALRHLKALLG